MDKENRFVTREKFNEVVYEIKQEINEVQNNSERLFSEVSNNNQHLRISIDNMNKNIEAQTKMMETTIDKMETMGEEVTQIQKDNITRDHVLGDYEKFKEETTEKLSTRFKETLTLFGIIVGVVGSVIVAIIQVAPNFF